MNQPFLDWPTRWKGKRTKPETEEAVRRRSFLNAREMKTIRAYGAAMKAGETKTLGQCARESGYPPNHSAEAVRRIKDILTRNEVFRGIMEKYGIGMETLVEDIGELRKAELPSGHPDNFIRYKNAELRAKLLDVEPSKKVELSRRSIHINITADTLEKIKLLKGEEEFKRIIKE